MTTKLSELRALAMDDQTPPADLKRAALDVCDAYEATEGREAARPIGTDADGGGIWTDGRETWNSGDPLTSDEAREATERMQHGL